VVNEPLYADHLNIYHYQNSNGIKKARKEIVEQIIAIEVAPSKIQTPISVAVENRLIREIFGSARQASRSLLEIR